MAADTRALRATVLRILRLWRLYARMDLVSMTRSPVYFLAMVVHDIFVNLAGAFTIFLLAQSFDGIGAWSRPRILFMLGYGATVSGLLNMFFSFNVLTISRRIGRGQMDHTLIQPQPIWMALATDGFIPWSGGQGMFVGIAIMVVGAAGAHIGVSLGWLAAVALLLASSAAIALSFSFIYGSLAFWSPRAAEEISTPAVHMVDSLKSFPLDGVGHVMLAGMMTVAPVGFVAWYPSRYLVGIDHSLLAMAATPLAAVAFVATAAVIFRKGLRHYERTGSQRYLDYGHRS